MTESSNGQLEASAQERVDLWRNAGTADPLTAHSSGMASPPSNIGQHVDNLKDTQTGTSKYMRGDRPYWPHLSVIVLLQQILAMPYQLFKRATDPLYRGLGLWPFPCNVCSASSRIALATAGPTLKSPRSSLGPGWRGASARRNLTESRINSTEPAKVDWRGYDQSVPGLPLGISSLFTLTSGLLPTPDALPKNPSMSMITALPLSKALQYPDDAESCCIAAYSARGRPASENTRRRRTDRAQACCPAAPIRIPCFNPNPFSAIPRKHRAQIAFRVPSMFCPCSAPTTSPRFAGRPRLPASFSSSSGSRLSRPFSRVPIFGLVLWTKVMSGAKLIWSRRDMGILRTSKHHVAYRVMAGAPDAVFAVSEQVRQHCIEVDRIDPRRVQTIYNGLDLSGWNDPVRPAKAPGQFLVTTVGNIRRVKGHDIFIKAAATIVQHFPGASFSIAGRCAGERLFRRTTDPRS